MQVIGKLDATKFASASLVGAPHGSGNKTSCNRLDHHRLCALDNPDQGVRHFQNMAACEARSLKLREPEVRDGIECSALTRDTSESTLSAPYAIKGRNPVADHHDCELRIRRNCVTPIRDEARAILLGQPIN